jgi:hypothetical protein
MARSSYPKNFGSAVTSRICNERPAKSAPKDVRSIPPGLVDLLSYAHPLVPASSSLMQNEHMPM